jgi:hypothetical protein
MNQSEKIYQDRLANEVGCIVCSNEGLYNNYVSIHHIDGRTKKGSHFNVIPLCGIHHQTGGEGFAIHPFKKQWEENFGSQLELKKQCDQILNK